MMGFLKPKAAPAPEARIPDGQRVYVIGDIHGRADLLMNLHDRILVDADAAARGGSFPLHHTVVYLGDYVDRGADSAHVLEILINNGLPGFEAVHLMGNHEDLMMRFLEGPATDTWLANGGDQTLLSYRVPIVWSDVGPAAFERLRCHLEAALPQHHRFFLESLRLFHVIGDYLFVHAGIRPGVPLPDQDPAEMIWIRDRFLNAGENHGYVVVHGHTISSKPQVRSNRIGIDTGAYFSDRLTCLVLSGNTRKFLHTGG